MYPASPGPQEPASPAYVAGPVVAAGPHAAASGSRAKLRAAKPASRAATPNITNGAYDPTDIYSSEAYDYNALYAMGHCCNPLGNSGSSPPQASIAIATFGSQSISDIQGFQTQYPYLAYNVQEVYIDGTPACCDAEGTMDVEWSTAMSNSFGASQDTAKVYLYDGANFNDSTFTDIYNQMVSDNAARTFSTSWSCTELYGCNSSEMSTRDAIFSEMTGQGWTLVAASGDRGAYDDCSHLSVSFPASDPNVVGAGGTELGLGSGPLYNSEVAWSGGPDGCASNDGGSGGGCSSVFTAPSFQSNQPCGSGSRAVPDISLNADWYHTPQNYYFGGALSGNGGTSIVAPELAGFFAQEDSYLLAEGSICGSGSSACAPLGNADYPIYETWIDSAPHDPFYDITSGCNTNDVGTGYCAGTGYDLVTGWGSANMLQLAWALNWHLLADDGRPTVTFSGPTSGVWYNSDQTVGISVADTGGGFPASGVAGFSDAWNVDPGDPTGEPTPGAGNSFYDGPEFPNATSGSLDLAAQGQGCHTVHVEAWDNMGLQSGDVTDGPLCYDTTAPSGTIKIDGGAASTANTALNLTLSATNPTAGDPVSDMAFSVNGGPYGAFQPYSTSATVTVPAGQGTQTVSVKYRNGAGGVSAPVSDTIWLGAPIVSSVVPDAGSTAGGNTVTINGNGFAPGTKVKFSSTGASLPTTFVSGAQIKVVAPAHAAGWVNVFATTSAGTSSAVTGDVYGFGAPTISSVVPDAGATAGGNTVTINGNGFVPGASVKFGSIAGTAVTFVSGTQLTVKAPAHAAGSVHVSVTTAAGTDPSSNNDVYAFGAPTVTGVSPRAGSTAGGNTVTITGGGFAPGATVRFGSIAGTAVTYVNASELTVKAPAHAAGSVHVSVTTGAGTDPSSNSDVYAFGAPTVTGVSPRAGSTAGGNTVTITGGGFAPGATVRFGSTAGTAVTYVNASELTVKAPAHAAGSVHVSVTTAAGTDPSSNSDVYAFGAPTVTGVSPRAGSTAGGNTVTITGSGFAPGATVKFGSTAGTAVTFVSGTQLTVKAPAHAAGSVHVSVTTAAGTDPSSNNDVYAFGAPTVTGVGPTAGSTAGGNTVTITGSGFAPGATVKFGSTAGTAVTYVSGSKLTVKAPAHAAGSVHVSVTTPAGTSPTGPANTYSYTAP